MKGSMLHATEPLDGFKIVVRDWMPPNRVGLLDSRGRILGILNLDTDTITTFKMEGDPLGYNMLAVSSETVPRLKAEISKHNIKSELKP
jgi:hypothetical protein